MGGNGLNAGWSRRRLLTSAAALTVAFTGRPLLAQTALRTKAPDNWKQDWEKTIAAAKKEGELVISGPSGRNWREFLMTFQDAFPGIAMKVTPLAGRDFWPRLIKEREIGQYLWDLRVGGSDNNTHVLRRKGYFQPIRDQLVLPEVLDENAWYGGVDGLFNDTDKRFLLTFALYRQGIATFNKKFIKGPLDVKDVVKPEYIGKISMADPRGGSSLSTMAVLLKFLGEDFVKKLIVDQQPVITKDRRQQLQWLLSGRYPIAFGLPTSTTVEYAERGGSLEDLDQVEGVLAWSQGVGGASFLTHAPHPNAAKVFLNWILTQDVQEHLMKKVRLNSRRKSVTHYDPENAIDPAKLPQAVGSQSEEITEYQNRAAKLLRQIMAQ
jgi:iron(III) transport system substrate-binding protein